MGYSFTVLLHEIILVMKCPNDQSELIFRTQDSVYAFCCSKCKGVFLQAKDTAAFKHNFQSDYLDRCFQSDSCVSIQKPCANCHQLMWQVTLDKTSVTICKNCKSAFFEAGQLHQFQLNNQDPTDSSSYLLGCLPASFVAIYALFKYFSLDEDSKNKKYYGWLFVIAVFFMILFWSSFSNSSIGCS